MSRRGVRRRIARGVYQDRFGLAATVVVRPYRRERRFPRGTPLKTIKAWQDETRSSLRQIDGSGQRPGFLAADLDLYLRRVSKTIAFLKDREREIRAWLPRFGHRRRATLTTGELNAQLDAWRNDDGLSASTVNKRRDALSHLFKKLDGARAPNPVAECVRFARPLPEPRGIDRLRITRVLGAIQGAKTKARLQLMHWTGMRPSQMARLRPTDFDLDIEPPAIYVPIGKRGRPRWLPLTPEGVDAARAFIASDAFGSWSCPSAYKAIVRAAAKVDLEPFTVYSIRHSFATALRKRGVDLADIKELLGHTVIATTEIYAPPVSARQVEALNRLRDVPQSPMIKASMRGRQAGNAWHQRVAPSRRTR